MHALRDRLLLAEDDFLAALAEGDGAVVAFNERWEALVADVDAVLESTGLDEQTSALVHSVAFRIATLADTSAEVFESSDLITSDLVAQVEDLVSQLRLEDNTLSVSPPPSHPVSLASPSHSTVCPDLEDSASRRKRRGSSNGTPDRRKRQRTASSVTPNVPVTLRRPEKQETVPSSLQIAPITPAQLPFRDQRAPALKRKRCISESDGREFAHATKRLHVGPRLHAVSDTFAVPRAPSSIPSTVLSTDRGMLDCLDIQALDTSSLASPGTITQIAPCQDLDGLDFSGYYPTPLDSDALDAFLTSLLNSNVSPSLPASIPTSLFSPSDVQRPSSRLSLSSSLTSSRGSSPTSSPLDTPPSSPSIAAISLDTSFSGRPSVLSFPEDDLLASCGVNACDHSSSLLSLGIDLDFGWQTLLDLDPSTWAASPSSHISKPSPKPKESVGGLDVASSSAIAFIQDDGRNGS